jgi:hypothetical protein
MREGIHVAGPGSVRPHRDHTATAFRNLNGPDDPHG